jgi:30S ribosomal protein S31
MGKGDRRSRKGKIWRGTNGNTRPRKKGGAAPQAKGKEARKK